MRELALGLALCAALTAATASWRAADAGPLALKLEPDTAVETAGLLALGMRRLAADLGLVRLLVYYGTPEGDEAEEHEHAPFDPEHPERSWGGGRYHEIGPRARRILALDPTFTYAGLYAAGALAFNLNRPEEALDILEKAHAADPRNERYAAYIAAIGFHRKGDPKRVLEVLEPTLKDPDCPTMIKHLAAFLYRRTGRRADAVRLYREIVETSRDAGYVGMARRALAELGERP